MSHRIRGFFSVIGNSVLLVIALSLSFVAMASLVVIAMRPLMSYWTTASSSLPDTTIAAHTKMYDKNGTEFADIWSQNRDPVASLDDVSPNMKHAILSAEDKDFYSHGAINLAATVRSLISSSGGGSGITQQLIKNLQYLSYNASISSKERATATTISRKLQEMKMAQRYEKTHTKDQILLKYLNTISIGAPNVYGIETASKTVFDKSAKDLTIGEAAALAGSVNNTSRYDLLDVGNATTAKYVKARQTYVLDRMLANGYITRQEHDDAVKAPITTDIQDQQNGCGSSKYPFYCQYVLDYIANDKAFGDTAQERSARLGVGGFAIHTMLDPTVLTKLEAQLKGDYGVTNRAVQATAVVQPGTGGVTAIGANRDWGLDSAAGQTEMVLADSPTQVGSTYKMITLAAALNQGWTEGQLMNDITAQCPWKKAGFDYPSGGITVSTSCALQGGHLTYLQATAYSSNAWFAELESRIGVLNVKKFSAEVGLNTPDSITARSASFTLGVVGDTPIQMAAAYATFANKGVYCPATPISSIGMMDGSTFTTPDDYDPSQYACKSVMSPKSASIVLKAQNANVNDASIPGRFGIAGMISGRSTVGKSGTGDNYANLSWSQTTAQMVVFADAYDPRGNFAYPLNSTLWRGVWEGPNDDFVTRTTRDFIVNALTGVPNVNLDMSSTQTSFVKTDKTSVFLKTVPNVIGMSPGAALKTMENAGFDSRILKKEEKDTYTTGTTSYSKGTVIVQSLPAGTKLGASSKQIIQLTIKENSNE